MVKLSNCLNCQNDLHSHSQVIKVSYFLLNKNKDFNVEVQIMENMSKRMYISEDLICEGLYSTPKRIEKFCYACIRGN